MKGLDVMFWAIKRKEKRFLPSHFLVRSEKERFPPVLCVVGSLAHRFLWGEQDPGIHLDLAILEWLLSMGSRCRLLEGPTY